MVLGHMSMASTAYRVALAAVDELDVRVLLTVGRRFDLDQLDAVPHNVHVERWVNQSDVLAEADVVVCHGGSGTTFGALAAGAGVTLDTGATGGGRCPLSWADVSPLSEAIETVRRDRSYRLAAHQVATEMAAAPTIDELLTDLLAQ